MSAGKGMTPRKGYNYQAYADNYDQIFRKPTKPKQLKTMKTNQDGKQPAPVLAWHRQADHEANDCARAVVGLVEDHTGKELSLEDCMKITKCVRMAIETCARSNSHYAPLFTARVVVPKLEREIATLKTHHATTVRLLGEAEPYVSRSVIGLANAIRTHLAALQQEGAAK